jgi:excinuclease ABC subunit C
MQNEMKDLSEKIEFEQALHIRNEITALQALNERQNVQRQKAFNEDILNYQIKDNNVYLLLFNIDKGTLHNKNEFVFEYNSEFFEEFMLQYYSENPVPKELILPKTLPDPLSQFLEEKRGNLVKITVPKRGEKKQLLDLVDKNIDITFFSNINKIETLKNRLNLQDPPTVIECFDISHLSGTSMVGSMVQFRNGKPDKSNYRRFRIRTVAGIDDVASIGEIVRRRYIRLKNEGIDFPDLIIIDGGRGQLNCALHELECIGLKIPVISLAKHYEEVYVPGVLKPIRLSQKDKALQFIQEIRDEAHRFAISYNRLLRKKEMIS